MADLRLFAVSPPAIVTVISAPSPKGGQFGAVVPVPSPVPASGGFGQAGGAVASYLTAEGSLAIAEAAPGERISAIKQWWSGLAGELHRAVYQRGTQIVTGVSLPAEGIDPRSTTQYLADLVESVGTLNGWPDVAARHGAAMRSTPPAPTVVGTVNRLTALGPPHELPGAVAWYDVAQDIQLTASLISMGEQMHLWSTRGRQIARTAGGILDRFATWGESLSPYAAAGAGLAIGIAMTGLVVYLAGPELVATRTAIQTAK